VLQVTSISIQRTTLASKKLAPKKRLAGFGVGKGSRKNRLTFLGVGAPGWQGAKAPRKENGIFDRNIKIFQVFATQPAIQDASAHKNVKLFLREP
jgi:hypothetical protein